MNNTNLRSRKHDIVVDNDNDLDISFVRDGRISESSVVSGPALWRQRISTLITAAIFVAIGALALYYSRIIDVILYDKRVHRRRITLDLGLFALVCCVIVSIWSIWIIPLREKRAKSGGIPQFYDDMEILIKVASSFGVVSAILMIIGLWPVWGFMTPVILFAISTGFVMLGAFIPF